MTKHTAEWLKPITYEAMAMFRRYWLAVCVNHAHIIAWEAGHTILNCACLLPTCRVGWFSNPEGKKGQRSCLAFLRKDRTFNCHGNRPDLFTSEKVYKLRLTLLKPWENRENICSLKQWVSVNSANETRNYGNINTETCGFMDSQLHALYTF